MAKTLNRLTGKGVPFIWKEETDEAFNKLKEQLTKAPILVLPEPNQPFTIYMDASRVGLGCVLMQNDKVYCLCFKTV